MEDDLIAKIAKRHNVSRNKVHAILDDWMAGTTPTKDEIDRRVAQAYYKLRDAMFLPSYGPGGRGSGVSLASLSARSVPKP